MSLSWNENDKASVWNPIFESRQKENRVPMFNLTMDLRS
jgi:hypothetical protein